MKSKLKIILELSKVRITIAVAFTTLTAYIIGAQKFDIEALWVTIGLFIVACGAAILNQYQESDLDKQMSRTKNRPIPSGKISKFEALIWSVSFIFIGSLFLFFTSGLAATSGGLLAMIWYNFIYTPLKRITPYAFIPGSVIGAIPPLTAWVAAGRSIFEIEGITLGFFFFIWQIPHFWLLYLKYHSQYSEAGFPKSNLSADNFNTRLITLIWIVATAVSALMLPLFGVVNSLASTILISLSAAFLIFAFLKPVLKPNSSFIPIKYFMKINYFVLSVIIVLSLEYLVF
jgi:protoheme IX farnesyltransferase